MARKLDEFDDCPARIVNARLRNETSCIRGFVPALARGIKSLEEFLGVEVEMPKGCLKTKYVRAIARRDPLASGLKNRVTRGYRGVVKKH